MTNIFESSKVNKIAFGGDYNPEQWDDETKQKDMELLPKANIDIVTLNVFSWAMLQPSEDEYDFSELDSNIKMVTENGMNICLATSTGAHPAWMAKKYPEVLRTDFEGRHHKFGMRHNSCPNSPIYRKYSALLVGKLAERYKNQDNIVVWHINNEYGGECYCENCEKAFRVWLKEKYKTLDNLNYEWATRFWGHTFYDWDEIVLPNALSEQAFGMKKSAHPSITLDYKRFNSDSILNNYIDEANAIRKHIPDAKITTNFMMEFKGLDYMKWADKLDVISWDSYPENYMEPAYVAFNHDIMRGLKQGQPFMLMEQCTTSVSWRPYNTMKRPGTMRLISYQAVAHGSDTLMFFQMRKSAASSEMYHGAIIDHSGREDARCYIESKALGEELNKIGDKTLNGRVKAKVALVFDWDNWWAIEEAWGVPYAFKYFDQVLNYYRAVYELNVPIDIVGTKDSLDKYDIVLAPHIHLIKDNIDNKLIDFAKNGGTVVLSLFSGYVSETDRVITGGYPGPFKELTGNWVEDTCDILDDEVQPFTYDGCEYDAKIVCNVIHNEGSESLGEFRDDYIKGMSAVTVNSFGKGKGYYVGVTTDDHSFYRHLMCNLLSEKNIEDAAGNRITKECVKAVAGCELNRRISDKHDIIYAINHNKEEVSFKINDRRRDILTDKEYNASDKITIMPRDVIILEKLDR